MIVALHCCNSTVPLHYPIYPPTVAFLKVPHQFFPGFLNKVAHGENPMPCGRFRGKEAISFKDPSP